MLSGKSSCSIVYVDQILTNNSALAALENAENADDKDDVTSPPPTTDAAASAETKPSE
jgi:hypothetical protein